MFTRALRHFRDRHGLRLVPLGVSLALVAAPLVFLPSAASADSGSSLAGSPFNGSDGVLDAGMTKAPDPVGTADLTNYSGGKEDDLCPPVVQGTAASKNDFDYTAAAAQPTPDGVFVYLAWHRGDGQGGTTSMDFELNQSTLLACNHSNPVRTIGDLLIGYDFQGNSTVPALTVRTWDGSNWGDQSAAQKALLTGNSEASGGENGSFGELVINMTGAGIFDPHACEDLATAFAKSRSSTSFSSEIKDFTTPIGLEASNCGSIDLHKVDDAGAPIGGVTFTLYADANGSQGAAVTPATACTTNSAGDCTIDDIWPGNYWVAESNVPSTNTAVEPFPITVGLITNSLADPVEVVNPRRPVHVSLHKQDDAAAPMSGVQFGLSTDQTATHVVPGGTCTTNSGGDCTITATVNAGDYWVVEMSSPEGYHLSSPIAVHLVPGASIDGTDTLQFTDARKTSNIGLDKKVNGVDTSASQPLDVEVGSDLTYSLTITNDGELPLVVSSLTDTLEDPLPASCPALGSSLAAGASVTCSYPATATDPGSPSIVQNTAAVSGVDMFGGTRSGQDETYVHVLNPAIHIVKQADAAAVHLGDTVHYTLTVTNPGNTALGNVVVADQKCDEAPALTSKQGSDDWLDPGETWVFGCSHQTTSADEGSVLNTAVASGTDRLGFTVDSTGRATTAIINPAIGLTKTGPATAHVDDTLVYTLTVTNPGDTPLHDIAVSDGQCDADPVRIARAGNDDILDPGEVWVYQCSHAVLDDDHDPFVNHAHVVGDDILDTPSSADDQWSTAILRPAISITKTGPSSVHVGDAVVYTLVVTNPGNAPLADVTVSDPTCDGPPVGSTDDADGLLSPGETWTYHCTHVATVADGASILNTATARGTDPLGETVDNTDHHTAVVLHPAITIDKTATPDSISASGSVTYTYGVTNTGDATLFNVLVTDDILGAIGSTGSLAPGQSITLAKTVDVDASTPPTNIGTVTGTDVLGETVTANDSATITVVLGEQVTRPAPAPELPRTGAPLEAETRAALTLIDVGLMLELSGRRRRRTRRRAG